MSDILAMIVILLFALWQSERIQRLSDKQEYDNEKTRLKIDKESRDRDRDVDRRERQALTAMLVQETQRRESLQKHLGEVIEHKRNQLLIGSGEPSGGQQEGYIISWKFIAPKIVKKKP